MATAGSARSPRTSRSTRPTGEPMIAALFFYLFAGICVASAFMVIAARNPVHSVLYLILAFVNAVRPVRDDGRRVPGDDPDRRLCRRGRGAVPVRRDDARRRFRRAASQGVLQYLPIGVLVGGIFLAELLLVVGAWAIGPGVPQTIVAPISGDSVATPRRSASCSTRATSISSRPPAWCCWSP